MLMNGRTLIEVLKTSRPYDEEGEETIVSRHAVDESIATIAQQAERIKELETIRGNGVLVPGPELKKMQEQLAAAEKAMNRCYKMLLSEPDTKGALFKAENILREALADAAIAAGKEGEKL